MSLSVVKTSLSSFVLNNTESAQMFATALWEWSSGWEGIHSATGVWRGGVAADRQGEQTSTDSVATPTLRNEQ